MYNDRKPICQKEHNRISRDEIVSDEYEDDGTGGKVRVTHYSDGSTEEHHGGMSGTRRSDKYGREC